MKLYLSLLLSVITTISFAQEAKKQENIAYIVDNVPIINDPEEGMGTLSTNDVDHLKVVTNKDSINSTAFTSADKVIYIFTKEYVKRPDDIRKIPTTKIMENRSGVWYMKDSKVPYSGKFIDYFMSGKIQGDGTFKDGVANGTRTVYYENGNKSYFRNYVNGVSEGYSEEYFLNGKLKQKGSFKNGLDDGLWQDFYSTGEIKRQTIFLNLKPQVTKDEEKFYTLLNDAKQIMKDEDYGRAIKKLDQAEKLNGKYSDLYFYRGTAKLDNMDFDNAILDFDKAIALEPLYMEAVANRAFARIRKHEFKNSRTLSKNAEVTILATKDKIDIPTEENSKICSDLNKTVELGDHRAMILDAIKSYCN